MRVVTTWKEEELFVVLLALGGDMRMGVFIGIGGKLGGSYLPVVDTCFINLELF